MECAPPNPVPGAVLGVGLFGPYFSMLLLIWFGVQRRVHSHSSKQGTPALHHHKHSPLQSQLASGTLGRRRAAGSTWMSSPHSEQLWKLNTAARLLVPRLDQVPRHTWHICERPRCPRPPAPSRHRDRLGVSTLCLSCVQAAAACCWLSERS